MRRHLCLWIVALAALALVPATARGRLAQQQIAEVRRAPTLGAQVPMDQTFVDAATGGSRTLRDALGNRVTILLLVDYTCRNVCDPMLAMTLAALRQTGLGIGTEAGLVVVGIDPADDARSARDFLAKAPGAASEAGVTALVGGVTAVQSLLASLDYRTARDPDTGDIAHPAVAMVLTPEGRLAQVLSPLALRGRDLRLALVKAADGQVGTLQDRLMLICYGFDAERGIYTPLIRTILSAAAALTIVVIAAGIVLLARAGRKT